MKIAKIFGVSDFRGKRGSSPSLGMKEKSDLISAEEERTGDMEKARGSI